MAFRENVKKLMDKHGLIAKELALRAKISVNTLNMYLGYKESLPNVDIGVKIAKALDTTVEYLVTGIESSSGIVIAPEDIELIKKIHLLDDIDKKVVEDLIQSFIDRKRSEVSAMETSRLG